MNTTTTSDRIRKVIFTLSAGMAKHPEDVELEIDVMAASVEIHLWVNQADMPVVVGSRGDNLKALEFLAEYIAAQEGKSARFRLEEARRGEREPMMPFEPRSSFNTEPTREMLEAIAGDIFNAACVVTQKPTGRISTTYHVTPPPGIDATELALVSTSLNALLHAHGKAKHGRLLFVGIATGNEPAQPRAGRNAPEIKVR